MTLSKAQTRAYRRLKDSGVQVSKENTIKPNTGSETSKHLTAKALTALVGLRNGYRVDSEVPIVDQYGNEVYADTLLWGHDSRMSYCVEAETSPTRETIEQKLDQYVRHTAIDELIVLNLNGAPHDIVDCYGWIGSELGLPE